jgi:hypothetical protein
MTISTVGVAFQMPDASGSSPTNVNYMLDIHEVGLTESNTITAVINVAASGLATFLFADPDHPWWYRPAL